MTTRGGGDALRAQRRLLRLLEKGAARLQPAADADQVLVDAGERGTIGLPKTIMRGLERRGAVVISDGRVTLGKAGDFADEQNCHATDPFEPPKPQIEEAVIASEAGLESVSINVAESPLALLWRLKAKSGQRFISPAEFRAGERLRTDYSRGQIMPRMGVNWVAAGGSGRKRGDANGIADLTDAALSARRRVERAVDAVGPEMAGVLVDVCCFLKGLERVETERGWPARSAKVVLKSALSALARHYEPQARQAERQVLHWGADDYRPSLR
ncbi:DUF6456 domain-containing protein [Mesorhizobium sp. CAU 1741]|uniref:DUF6456 domain-containing protein n=1 Tax=Mesorhizobium sp. CAU 1741 TaxID=3140366 RepID=UPI00325A59FC